MDFPYQMNIPWSFFQLKLLIKKWEVQKVLDEVTSIYVLKD